MHCCVSQKAFAQNALQKFEQKNERISVFTFEALFDFQVIRRSNRKDVQIQWL